MLSFTYERWACSSDRGVCVCVCFVCRGEGAMLLERELVVSGGLLSMGSS